jgi:hypothetical protein
MKLVSFTLEMNLENDNYHYKGKLHELSRE